MTRVLIETKVGLNPSGVFGMALLVGAPVVGAAIASQRLEQVSQSIRYAPITGANVFEDWTAAFGFMCMSGAISLAVSLFGLVLVMVGRTYTHDVRSDG